MADYKKVIFGLLITIVLSFAAQGDSTLNESFNSAAYPLFPELWRRFSLDIGSNNMWERAAGGTSWTQPGHAMCMSNNAIRNDDWLITRMVVPSSDSQNFRFGYRAQNTGTFESLDVWVSTTTQDPTGMTTRLDSFRFNNTAYVLRTVNLSAYINIPIFIGIRYPKLNGQRVRVDSITGPRYPALDMAPISISNPGANFLLESLFTPSAVVKNYGSASPAANFSVACTIYNAGGTPVYQDLQSVAPILPNTSTLVNFTATTLNVGYYTIAVRTELSGDMQTTNDRMVKQISVFSTETEKFYDDGIPSAILIPGNSNGSGVKFGTDTVPSSIYGVEVMLSPDGNPALPAYNLFRIQVVSDTGDTGVPGPVLWESNSQIGIRGQWNYVPIPGVVITTDSFYIFWIQAEDNPNCVGLVKDGLDNAPLRTQWDLNAGVYSLKADVGDRMIRSITSPGGYIDAQLTQIVQPIGIIDTFPIIPRVTVRNNGTGFVNIPVELTITKDTVVYRDTNIALNVGSGSSSTIGFPIFYIVGADTGNYTLQARTLLLSDQNPGNDLRSGSFRVRAGGGPPPTTSWQTMSPIPSGASGKSPKAGTCMAGLEATGKIYLLKATNTSDFHIFTPNGSIGSWTSDSMPLGTKETFDGKKPKKGAAMAAHELTKAVYILRGSNTQGFWKFQADTLDSLNLPGWKKLKEIPMGTKAPKDGSGLATVTIADTDYIFAMKGSKTSEFYLYNIAVNTWSAPLPAPPAGPSGKLGYKKGSCLAYDGAQTVYVLKGNYGDFFKYDLDSTKWTQLKRYDKKIYVSRENKKKSPKDGAALVYYNSNVYMLKGGNTNEVWQYSVISDSWSQADSSWTIPTGSGKKVKGGGCMICFGDYFYAAKGSNTPEFYMHSVPYTGFGLSSTFKPEVITGNKVSTSSLRLMIAPNPAKGIVNLTYNLPEANPISCKLYDVSGALVKSYDYNNPAKQGMIKIDATKLATGVYILRFDSGKLSNTRKLVIQR